MKLTPEACAAVYDCLRQFAPFRGWRLPPADEVEFHIVADQANRGTYCNYIGTQQHCIEVSDACVGHFDTLAGTIAHEMIHLCQKQIGTVTRAQHNADFLRRAARVCRELGWDPKAF